LYKRQRQSRQSLHQQQFDTLDGYGLDLPMQPSRLLQNLPMLVVGAMLMAAFAFAGNLIGRNASAHNAGDEEMASAASIGMMSPMSDISTKGSLLPEGESFATINVNTLRRQTVIADGKGDLEPATPVVAAVPPPLPKARPANLVHMASAGKVKISPASVDLKSEDVAPAVKRLVTTPAEPSADASLNPEQKQQIVAQRRVRLAEENCLARAVYFESRSESDLGQLAVAKVILNRVKNPDFPKTICGVVYQGSGSRNSCQFSFACDGLPDDVKSPGAWAHAKMIAERAINNDPAIAMLGSAVNYHADYVTPRWSHTMRRLIRIGHHIFYANRG
jgi:spore germination cell wall hydrolase CwlJ-like protein